MMEILSEETTGYFDSGTRFERTSIISDVLPYGFLNGSCDSVVATAVTLVIGTACASVAEECHFSPKK
jgi:hypothetical protein